MPAEHDPRAGAPGGAPGGSTDETPGGTTDPTTDGGATAAPHDETGLDLARSVARALARPGTRPRRPGGGPAGAPGAGGGRGAAGRGAGRGRPADPQASGAHPDERDPQLLDSTIGRLVADQGWGTDVRVHGVFSRWESLVGREVAAHCSPEAFADARLVVRTDSTAWATQVRLLAGTVVRRLNEELGDGTVLAIEVRGPLGPSWKRGPRSVRDGRGPRDTYG